MRQEEVVSGVATVPLRTVSSGTIEGFAGRKSEGTTTGSWIRCTMSLDEDILSHFMVSALFDFNTYSNWLSVALCPLKESVCRTLDGGKMYHNDYDFLRRREYYYVRLPVKICYDDICMIGIMDLDHTPIVHIGIYPRSYHDIDYTMRQKIGGKLTVQMYNAFIETVFG